MPDDVRERLIAATADIIDEQGPLRVRIEEILDRARCSRSTLYRHVSDKDELVREVILARANAMAAIVAHQIEGIADPAERIAQGLLLFTDALRSERWYKSLEIQTHAPQALARVGGGLGALTAMISPLVEGLLHEYAEAGHLHEDIDPHDAVEWLVGVTLNLLEPYAQRSREHRLAILKRYAIYPLIKPASS